MASRVISILATLFIVTAMVAPVLAQSGGGSPGTSGGSTSGSGNTPGSAPSAIQPGTPIPSPGAGATGKAVPGQSGTGSSAAGSSTPSSGAGDTAGTSKAGTGTGNGAGSDEVRATQKALQDKGMDPGPIDGIIGPKTVAALKAFQKDQKLTETGRLDEPTREKLGVSR